MEDVIFLTSPGLELANPGGGSGDLHGFLTTAHHHLNRKSLQFSKDVQSIWYKHS